MIRKISYWLGDRFPSLRRWLPYWQPVKVVVNEKVMHGCFSPIAPASVIEKIKNNGDSPFVISTWEEFINAYIDDDEETKH